MAATSAAEPAPAAAPGAGAPTSAPASAEGPLVTPPTLSPLLGEHWWMVAGLALALALLLAVGAGPAYRAVRTWRSHRLVAAAEVLMSQAKWGEAAAKAQAAYHLSPQDPRTIRLVARLYSAANQREALKLWQSLVAVGQATPEDRREMAVFALRVRDLPAALEQSEWLLGQQPGLYENLKLGAQCSAASGNPSRAKDLCRRALQLKAGDADLRLLLARLLAQSVDVGEQVEALRTIRALAEAKDASGLEALEVLARLRHLPREDADAAADRLDRHALARAEHRLLAAELRLRWHPERRSALIDAMVARCQQGDDGDRLALGRWLNRLGEYDRTLAALPVPVALRTQDLCLVHLDALGALGRWAEIERILEREKHPLDAVLGDLFRARAAKEQGRPEDAMLYWRKVHLSGTDKPAAWFYVAQYAELIGDPEEAERAYRRLTRDATYGRSAYEALIRLGEAAGNTHGLREIMREMMRTYPGQPEPRNDFAYLSLLLEQDAQTAREIARVLVEESPNYLAYRTTLALAHLRLHELDKAASLYEGLQLDWGTVLPGWQAVRVAVLGAQGKTNLARVSARRIPFGRLKPEERALIQPYL